MASRSPIKAILFDKDGVLVDFEKTWTKVLFDMVGKLAEGDEDLFKQLLTSAGWDHKNECFPAGSVWAAGHTGELVDVWLADTSFDDGDRLADFINASCLDNNPVSLLPLNQLQSLFADLKAQGLILGIATNDVYESAVRTMNEFDLTRHLAMVIGYDSVANPKPDGDQLTLFCSSNNLTGSDVLVVGDNLHDMDMASAGGAGVAVGVLSGNANRDMLAPRADFIIDDVGDLPGLLEREKLVA